MLLFFSFLDQTLVVKAIQDIKEGEEILHCYGMFKVNNKISFYSINIRFLHYIIFTLYYARQGLTLEECQKQIGKKVWKVNTVSHVIVKHARCQNMKILW